MGRVAAGPSPNQTFSSTPSPPAPAARPPGPPGSDLKRKLGPMSRTIPSRLRDENGGGGGRKTKNNKKNGRQKSGNKPKRGSWQSATQCHVARVSYHFLRPWASPFHTRHLRLQLSATPATARPSGGSISGAGAGRGGAAALGAGLGAGSVSAGSAKGSQSAMAGQDVSSFSSDFCVLFGCNWQIKRVTQSNLELK